MQEPKYSDYTSFFTVKNCLNKINVLKKMEKHEAASLYYRTILKHIKVGNLIYTAGKHYGVDAHKLEKLYNKKQNTMKRLGVKNVVVSLTEENRQLDLIANRVEKLIYQRTEIEDQIEEEIVRLEEEFKVVNKTNHQRIQALQERVDSVHPIPNIVELPQKVVINISLKKKHRKHKSKSLDLTDQNAQQTQLEFIRKTILKLESKQVADSISKVVQTVPTGNGYQFNVSLEQALNTNYQPVEEELLHELDSMRDISLFKFYNIPQKTRYSHIAHNVCNSSNLTANRLKPNTLIQRNLLNMMKQQSHQNQPIDQITTKFDSCHHCRMLFREENLMACNYRSGTMGLPIINSAISDPYMLQQIDNEKTMQNPQNRRFVSNRKRNSYSMYARKSCHQYKSVDGELICSRKYCRQCLKQCYEYNISETSVKNDWVCPFCQGICYCIRCQRNDILTKLKGMFMVLGGNMQELQESSLLEKYVRPQQEEFYYKKKQPAHGFQVFKGFISLENRFNNFKNMQQVRVDFENLRHLCSCVTKREKIKKKDFDTMLQLWVIEKNLKGTQPVQVKIQKESDNLEESYSSEEDYNMLKYKFSKAKLKFEEKQRARLEKTRKLIQRFYPKHQHNPNSPPEDLPQIKLKRELSQLILTQDTETYNLVVKKIKEDETSM